MSQERLTWMRSLSLFDHFGMYPHGIANAEIGGVFAKLFRFDFIK